MTNFVQIVGLAVVVYAVATIDDLFVLVGFFADPRIRARHVVAGQFLAMAALFAASSAASLLAFVVRPPYLGLLGIAPIGVGLWKLWELLRHVPRHAEPKPSRAERKTNAWGKTFAVTAVAIANSSDNLGIWTPVLAVHPGQIFIFGLVFAAMTGIWCIAALWLVSHPQLGAPLRRYAQFVVPFLLIGLGIFVLRHAGSFRLIPA